MSSNRYPHMVHEYYITRLQEIMDARSERIAALKTRADAERYVLQARRAAKKAFGPMPKRTPHLAELRGSEDFGDYTLEKIVFQSRPDFFVTGNMYVPKGGPKKKPAVLGVCGHSLEGKACDNYQAFAQLLARHGFIVFLIDPIAQGERRQYYPEDGGPRPGLCTAHNLMGNQMMLTGEFFGTWRAWDGIRGLDVLLERPDVDRSHVGVTGNSGGGTLTTYLTALDPRFTMAAPSCYICSWLANMENEMPADSEQNPPGILKSGMDEVDLLLTYAPRPTIILGQELDFFDVRYARKAHEDLARVHRLLGSRDSADFFAGPTIHGYSVHNREAMLEFFMRQAGVKGEAKERNFHLIDEKILNATSRGEVKQLGSRPVFEFTADKARELAKKRGKPDAKTVRRAAARLLAVRPKVAQTPHHRNLAHYGNRTNATGARAVFAIQTEPGIQAILTATGPDQAGMRLPTGRMRLFVGHISSEDDVENNKELRALAKSARTFATVDPRGIGQSAAQTCNSKAFSDAYGADFLYAATGDMLSESYLGRRVHDVLRTLDVLEANGAGPVELVGRGLGSITVAFAALLHPTQPRVRLINYLKSYESLALAPRPNWPFSALLRGVLKELDLPDVYRALGKRLKKEKPWNEKME